MLNKETFTIKDALIAYMYVANGSPAEIGHTDRCKRALSKLPMSFTKIVWYHYNNPTIPVVIPKWLTQKEYG